MSRRMRLRNDEHGGFVEVLAIWEREGQWEDDWEPLRSTVVGDQFSLCSQDALDHALKGLSRPLTDALGPEPAGCLRKLGKAATECERRRECPFYDRRNCLITAKKMPWCFEPDIELDQEVRQCATKAIELWREGVYLVIVRETTHA